MTDLILIFLIMLGFAAGPALLAKSWRQPRFLNCRFCGDGLLTNYQRLDSESQAHISAYFKNHERRKPNFLRVFMCQSCQIVFDEYSNATKAFMVGGNRIPASTLCKACLTHIENCSLERDDIHCPRCRTWHQWRAYKDQPLKFLQPPADVQIRSVGRFTHGQLG